MLIRWHLRPAVVYQIRCPERFRMGRMGIERHDQGRPVLNQPHTRVTPAVNLALMAFRQSKPAFEIEIVTNLGKGVFTGKDSRLKARHDLGHGKSDRILGLPEAINQGFKLLLPFFPSGVFWFECRSDVLDVRDIFVDRFLFGADMLESPLDTDGQSTEFLFCGPPFFAFRFR